jgi:hypothetical protein
VRGFTTGFCEPRTSVHHRRLWCRTGERRFAHRPKIAWLRPDQDSPSVRCAAVTRPGLMDEKLCSELELSRHCAGATFDHEHYSAEVNRPLDDREMVSDQDFSWG